MSNLQSKNQLLKQIEQACKKTNVTAREVLKELSPDDISMLKSGDLTIDYLISLVLDLNEEKNLFSSETEHLTDVSNYEDSSQDESSHL